MKVFINGVLYSPETTPVIIVFKDDKDRLAVAGHIASMEPKDGARVYSQFPEGMSPREVDALFDEALDKATEGPVTNNTVTYKTVSW